MSVMRLAALCNAKNAAFNIYHYLTRKIQHPQNIDTEEAQRKNYTFTANGWRYENET